MNPTLGFDNYGDGNFAGDQFVSSFYENIRKDQISISLSQISIISPPGSRLSDFVLHIDEDCECASETADEERTCLLSINLVFFLISYLSFFYYSIGFWKTK